MTAQAAASSARPTPGGTALHLLVAADWRRMRHTWILPLTLMGPIGVTLLGIVLFLLRGDYILSGVRPGLDPGFAVVVGQLGLVHVFAICLGATLLASMIVDVEHRSDTWKAFFALPVRRWKAYVVKFLWVAALLALSSALMGLGYAAITIWQGVGPVPWDEVARVSFYPWVGVLPLLAFQLLASTTSRNQALPLGLGIVTPMFGIGMSDLPNWLPWRLPTEALGASMGQVAGVAEQASHLSSSSLGAIAAISAAVLLALGAVMLTRKEIR